MNVVVTRSPLRLLAYALLAVPAIVLAVDILFANRWFPAPDTYGQVVGTVVDAGGQTVDVTVPTLTVDGKAQRRRDLLTGGVLLAGGVAAMGWAAMGLMRPTTLLRAGEEGISVRVDGPRRPARLLPWESIEEVRSGIVLDEGAETPVLSIRFDDPAMVPTDPGGGVAEPPWLHVWSEDWDTPAHQVAPMLDPRTRARP